MSHVSHAHAHADAMPKATFLYYFAIVRSGRLRQITRPLCCTRMPKVHRHMPKLAPCKKNRARYLLRYAYGLRGYSTISS